MDSDDDEPDGPSPPLLSNPASPLSFSGFAPLTPVINSPAQVSSQGQSHHPITSSPTHAEKMQPHPVSPGAARSVPHPSAAEERSRIRLYNQSHAGPYTVFIREIDITLSPYKFAKYMNGTYKSIINMQRSHGKVRVQFGSWKEANLMATNPQFERYKVTIPADKVEICGAIRYDDLCDINDLQALVDDGKGIWGNSQLPDCRIIHAEHISRIDPKNPTRRIPSKTIKLTFAGQVLPTQIVIEGLRIRVRPFHEKPMFCDNCLQFGHTLKYCRRKPKCARCNEEHLTVECTVGREHVMCPFCLAPEAHDRNNCPFFNEVNQDFRSKQSNRRKARFQQAVAAAKAANPVPAPSIAVESEFPALSNNYATLPVDELEPAISASPAIPGAQRRFANPYAQVVKNGNRPAAKSRTAVKRPRSATTAQPTAQLPPVESRSRRPSTPAAPSSGSPAVAALKDAIVAFVRKTNIDETWLPIIEAIIEPLLQALLPQLPVLLGALGPAVLSSRHH